MRESFLPICLSQGSLMTFQVKAVCLLHRMWGSVPLGNATLLLHASLSLYSYNLLNMVFIGINELQCMKNDLKLSAAQIQLFVCVFHYTTEVGKVGYRVWWEAQPFSQGKEGQDDDNINLGVFWEAFLTALPPLDVASKALDTLEKTTKKLGRKGNPGWPYELKEQNLFRKLKRCSYCGMNHFGKSYISGFLPFKSYFMTAFLWEDLG